MLRKIKNALNNEIIIYIIAGVLTTAVDWCITFLLSDGFNLSETLSNAIAVGSSIIFAYIINSRWVFKNRAERIKTELKQFVEFAGARVTSALIQVASIYIFVDRLSFNHLIIKALTTIFVLVFNYAVSKLWIFKNRS